VSDAPLVVAVPSKGRLQENAAAFFARAGLSFTQARGVRDYRGAIAGVPGVELLFLSAAEIVTQLATGGAHLGVTGEDLLREAIPDADVSLALLTGLGFGGATVVVAVPQAWIDVRTMADLDEIASDLRARRGRRLRVATKYLNLTRRFFAAHGVVDYRIVESPGATEGAPAAGTADLIVDITTTGATLAANGLRVLDDGVILNSEANLVASLRAPWTATTRSTARTVLSRIAAEEEARTTREVRAASGADGIDFEALRRNHRATDVAGRRGEGEIVLRCPVSDAFGLVEALIEAGARDVSVRSLDYVFKAGDGLTAKLFDRPELKDENEHG
jgi:ATP phosphoribosyltransferase